MLYDKFRGTLGKVISYLLILTTHSMTSFVAYASGDFNQAVSNANSFAQELLDQRSTPAFDSKGNLMIGGEVYMGQKELTGQRDNDYLPASQDTFGCDSKTLMQSQIAQEKYEQKDLDSAETSGERAYHLIKRSMERQKPDLTNDPMWENTDNIYENLVDIAKDFANCTVSTELVTTGDSYHVPVYKQCERLPYREETVTLFHEYRAGVVKHHSGAMNLAPCGEGCMQMWIGTVGNDYWGGSCKIYEEAMSVKVLQPDKIAKAKVVYAKFDDWFQIWLNNRKVYNAPYPNQFPPETPGRCELSTSWEKRPNIDVTQDFRNVDSGGVLKFKTRTSVTGNGEGYARLEFQFDPKDVIYGEKWSDKKSFDRALEIINNKNINADGMCKVTARCVSSPSLDANGCTEFNGIRVCESHFKKNKFAPFGISPFCTKAEVKLDCGFNDGKFCTTNLDGVETCVDSTEQNTNYNQCKKYEEDPTCSFVKSECVKGAEGEEGGCYVQEDTYDCGFTTSNESTSEEQVIRCDGKLQCVGESCYSPLRDKGNEEFRKVAAYLEMLRYAQNDLACQGVPDAPFNPNSPPDQYIPVPTCPEGYKYDVDMKKCLQRLRCDYSENDFYAVSPRLGIEVLSGGRVVKADMRIPVCSTVVSGNRAYTCGEIQKKTGSDSFYEVCTNAVTNSIPASCPSTSHAINPATGFCEVPPVSSCPYGYNLVSGSDIFSSSDDKCVADPVEPTATCPANAPYFDANTGQCVGTGETSPTLACPSGSSLSGTKCRWTQGSTAYCSSGSLSGNSCVTTHQQCLFESGRSECVSAAGGTGYLKWKGVRITGYSYCPFQWVSSGGAQYKGGKRRYSGSRADVFEICKKWTTSATANRKCPSGYTLSGTNCIKNTAATPTCRAGYTYNSSTGKCEYRVTENPTYVCPQGYTYNANTSSCDKPDLPASQSCPMAFPVWDETEGRCKAKSLNPLASIERFIGTAQFEAVSPSELMAYALMPYKGVLGDIVPSAVANELVLPEQPKPAGVTKASMQAYIAGKFEAMAEDLEEKQALFAAGQRQLRQLAISRGMPMVAPLSASNAGGETNVVCELFKGERGECKVAVGGFQDCCESPVATTLADYITLTRTVVEMDGMTSSIFGLENYSGVWQTASEWTSEMASTAWDSVQGLFTSGADVAAQAGTDLVTEGAMSSLSQSIMSYTNEFLIETFGEEVAGMFFETVATEAGNQIGMSAAMQTAGSVMMVAYYAYLAYVVFNLLVNIIYECEEAELDLAMKVELLSAHAIGTYCRSEVMGVCVEKRRAYCVFDSPLSRIMMEQIYKQPQMGLSWGTPEHPNCTGLKLEDMDKVNWDEVNLDEWIGILISTDNYIAHENIDIERLTGTGSILNTGEGKEARENVLKRNQSRMEGMDLDKIRRDAYEDAWNDMK